MKYLKFFESKTKREIEVDLSGLLVELFDVGIDVEMKWLDNDSIVINLKKDDNLSNKQFKTDDVIDSALKLEDYMELVWNSPFISYTIEGVRLQRISPGYTITDMEIYIQKK